MIQILWYDLQNYHFLYHCSSFFYSLLSIFDFQVRFHYFSYHFFKHSNQACSYLHCWRTLATSSSSSSINATQSTHCESTLVSSSFSMFISLDVEFTCLLSTVVQELQTLNKNVFDMHHCQVFTQGIVTFYRPIVPHFHGSPTSSTFVKH